MIENIIIKLESVIIHHSSNGIVSKEYENELTDALIKELEGEWSSEILEDGTSSTRNVGELRIDLGRRNSEKKIDILLEFKILDQYGSTNYRNKKGHEYIYLFHGINTSTDTEAGSKWDCFKDRKISDIDEGQVLKDVTKILKFENTGKFGQLHRKMIFFCLITQNDREPDESVHNYAVFKERFEKFLGKYDEISKSCEKYRVQITKPDKNEPKEISSQYTPLLFRGYYKNMDTISIGGYDKKISLVGLEFTEDKTHSLILNHLE